jgi:hypothetical protein
VKRRYAVLAPFLLLLVTPPAWATAGDLGHDISYLQCTSATTPASGVFGIVSVIEGKPWDPVNRCLQAQVDWAAGLTSPPMLYVNSANPFTASTSHWPASGRTSPAHCVDRNNNGDPGCAYDYGWDAAQDALTKASAVVQGVDYVKGLTWWIDVEAANSWNGTGVANAADIQGMVDSLRSAGVVEVGIYANGNDWPAFTGSSALGTSAYNRSSSSKYRSAWSSAFTAKYPIEDGPMWFAGLNTGTASAQTKCTSTSLTGGERLLAQYADGSGFDADYRCADADHTRPTATMTLPTVFVTTAAKTTVAWKGADTGGSGIASFDLQTIKAPGNGTFGAWSVIGRRLLTTSLPFTSPARGATTCWRALARDAAGNTSASWSAMRCVTTPLDDRDLSASTGWTRRTGAAGWFRGSYSSATRLGATLTRTGLHTKHLVLLAYRCPTCGSVKVQLNGTTLKTVSLASATSGRVQIPLPLFSLRTTTVTLKVATSGKLVRIDGLATSRV